MESQRMVLTFKLLRYEKQTSIKQLCKELKINPRSYRDFEANNSKLTEYETTQLFEYYKIKKSTEADYSNYFKNLFNHIYYLDDIDENVEGYLNDHINNIIYSGFYIEYLIYKNLLFVHNQKFNLNIDDVKRNMEKLMSLINPVLSYLPLNFVTIFHLIIGECYHFLRNYKEALDYYEKALQTNTTRSLNAIITFQKANTYIGLQNTIRALDLLYEAKKDFEVEYNYNRAIRCVLLKGMIYLNEGLYDEALKSFHFIAQNNFNKFSKPYYLQQHIRLTRFFLDDYEYIINQPIETLEDIVIKAMSYYRLGNIDLSKDVLHKASMFKNQYSFQGTKGIIKMLRCILYHSKENTFLNAVEEVKKYIEGEYKYIERIYFRLIIEYYQSQNSKQYLLFLENEIIKKLY